MIHRSFLTVFVLATITLQVLLGCSAHPSTEPLSLPKLTVRENIIVLGDQPYAEVRFYGTAKLSESRGEAYLFSRETQHRGMAIYYFSDKALIWIYPEDKRWQEDVDRCCRSQTQGYYGWVFDVTISENGQQIFYKTPGFITRSSWAYSVVDRSSKRIDREWFPKK